MASFNESIVAYFGGDTSGLEKAVIKAEGVVGGFQSALGKIGVTLGTAAVLGFFKNVLDQVGRIDDLSKSLGLSTDAVQTFEFALVKAGGKAQDIQKLFQNVNRSLDELAVGNENTAESFRRLGLSQEELAGIPLEQALEKISAGYVENRKEAGAYSALIKIVGADSAKLMGILEDLGTNGFGKLKADAEDAGLLIKEDTIARLDELGDRIATVGKGIVRLGAELLALGTKASDGLGALAAVAVNYVTGIETAWDAFKPAEKAEQAVKALDAVATKIKGTGATLKDFMAFNEAEAKREIERLDMQGKSREKINKLLDLAQSYLAEAAKYGENTKEQLDYISKANELILQVDKEKLKVSEKATREAQELLKAKKDAVPVTQQTVVAEVEALDAAAERLRVERMISDEKDRQLQIDRSRSGIIDRKGMEPEQLTDTQLQAASDRLRSQLAQFRQQDASANRSSTFLENYRSPLTISAEQELQRIQKEQELRRSFNITVQNQGVNVAERTFSPTEFNRLQALYGSELQKNTEKLSSIESTLNAVFKKR